MQDVLGIAGGERTIDGKIQFEFGRTIRVSRCQLLEGVF